MKECLRENAVAVTDFDFGSRCVSASNLDIRTSYFVGGRRRISHGRCEDRCGVGREKDSRRLLIVSHLWQLDTVSGSEHVNCTPVIEAQSIVWYDG